MYNKLKVSSLKAVMQRNVYNVEVHRLFSVFRSCEDTEETSPEWSFTGACTG